MVQTNYFRNKASYMLWLLVTFMLCTQQMMAAKDNQEGQHINIDKVKYRIAYLCKMAPDTTKTPYNYWESETRLDIGNKTTHFYDRSKQVKDSIMAEQSNTGTYEGKKLPKVVLSWELYKNYPSDGETAFLDKLASNNYLCIEKVEVPNWEIIPDSSASIIGYKCQLAKTSFKGRIWYAWYTEDIPLNEGPWKLYGLPGLVLRAYDQREQYIFDAIGMASLNGSTHITFAQKKREKITQKELREAKDKFDAVETLHAMERKTGITFKGGLPAGAIKALNRRLKGNPIELE